MSVPSRIKTYIPIIYMIFLMLPLYAILMTSFKTEFEIKNQITPFPMLGTMANYETIFSDIQAMGALFNTIIYVIVNNIFTLLVAIPAAYAFSRYSFLGDKHFFFWFLVSRMTPPAAVAIPLVQMYSAIGIVDTHLAVALAHCLFTVPIAVWILEGFIASVPRELDETAYVDGYSQTRFFSKSSSQRSFQVSESQRSFVLFSHGLRSCSRIGSPPLMQFPLVRLSCEREPHLVSIH